MEKCPKCGKYTITMDVIRERRYCVSLDCDYKIYYCRHKYALEKDVLGKLLGKEIKKLCKTPKGLQECDTCELRA